MVMKTEVIEKNQTDGSATKAAAPMSSINKSSSSNKKMRKFKGVRMRSWGSWVSEIRAPNQKTRIWLGSYSTAEAAARAYDAALICLKGPSANLNFPTFSQQNFPLKTNDNLHHHHHHITNMSPKNIQKIAAQAANTLLHDNAISSSSTASVASSPSPSNTIEDHNNSLLSQFEEYLKPNETAVLNVMDHSVPWFNNFGSFKFREMIDDMLLFDDQQPPFKMIDNHVYEGEEDLRLWDFC